MISLEFGRHHLLRLTLSFALHTTVFQPNARARILGSRPGAEVVGPRRAQLRTMQPVALHTSALILIVTMRMVRMKLVKASGGHDAGEWCGC